MRISKNQFLLAPKNVVLGQNVEASESFSFDNYQVFLGEGCLHTKVQTCENSALLLGYILDAKEADADPRLMLERFVERVDAGFDNIIDCVRYWGGRWCLVFRTSRGVNVITDACGLKQVFYHTHCDKNCLAIASQARYLSLLYCLPEIIKAQSYIEKAQIIDREFSWPLDGCLYESVKRLLPNHILCEGTPGPKRLSFSRLRSKNSAADMAELLRSEMRSVQAIGKCAITLTAGWDSRLVLAAADKSDVKMATVTLLYQDVEDNNIDIRIAREICDNYGIKHSLVRCSAIKTSFENEYRLHSETPHRYWIQMSQAIRDSGFGDYFWVKGSCNEILRKSSGVLHNWQVNVKLLCKLFQIHYDDFSAPIVEAWLDEARPFCQRHQLDLLDLFYWEHRCGSWLAECLNESDVASEMFTPFNCRAYIETGLGVANKYKVSPDYSLFKEILQYLSFDLDIPINQGRYASVKSRMRCIIKNRLHLLYGLIIRFKPLL